MATQLGTRKPERRPGEPLHNPKHELRAHYRACGVSRAKAHRMAGFEGKSRQTASQVEFTNPDIAERIRELQEKAWHKLLLSPEFVKNALIREALAAGSDATRVKALELLGKTEAGGRLFVDRISNEGDRLSADALASLIAGDDPELKARILEALPRRPSEESVQDACTFNGEADKPLKDKAE